MSQLEMLRQSLELIEQLEANLRQLRPPGNLLSELDNVESYFKHRLRLAETKAAEALTPVEREVTNETD